MVRNELYIRHLEMTRTLLLHRLESIQEKDIKVIRLIEVRVVEKYASALSYFPCLPLT
jgi:hypothetical protein